MSDRLEQFFGLVTEHNLVVLVVLLLISAGVAVGVTQMQVGGSNGAGTGMGDSDLAQTLQYVQEAYGGETQRSATNPAAVYVRSSENALSRAELLESLRYQASVLDSPDVREALDGRRIIGVANLVARQLAAGTDPSLEDQIAALETATTAEVRTAVSRTLAPGSPALDLLPADYEPGSTSASSHRMLFPLAEDEGRSRATEVLYEQAIAHQGAELFTRGQHARQARSAAFMQNTMELIVPIALLVILGVLAFSYRDVVDVLVGFTGVVLSVMWMFGILGWLQIPAGISLIIGPVLIVGLSVDYGLHVFMRYREQRGAEEDIRRPMTRGLHSVVAALALVTLTAVVGFLANASSDLTVIKQLAYAITLGVLSTFVISLTLVPALKVTADRLLERVGFNRHTRPLGQHGALAAFLRGGATLAKRAAPVVIVVALVVGAAGALAWSDLDRRSVQQADGGVAEWKQELPAPLGWDRSEEARQRTYVAEHYRGATPADRARTSILIRGDLTDPATLATVQAGHAAAADSDVAYRRGGSVPLTSPLTVMRTVAAEHPSFAEQFDAADADDDGVPDRNLGSLYDALFSVAPERAAQVIHRVDGAYHSMRVIVPVEADATISEQAEGMRAIADAAALDPAVSTRAVGTTILQDAELSETANSILQTLVVALLAVGLLLTIVYRFLTGSALLGAVTAVPIVLVSALVIGGMWLLDVPLTVLTALLLSLVIGIGIDYNIHVSDRFIQERDRGRSPQEALVKATTGTGGALLGSTLTSAGAFSALLLHPHPQLQSFGTLVVLAMVTSFVVAVFVLPSLLLTLERLARVPWSAPQPNVQTAQPSQD